MTDTNTYQDYYFKALFGQPAFMSGLPLPDPNKGPYTFRGCEFHPRLWKALEQMYSTSTFIDCYRS